MHDFKSLKMTDAKISSRGMFRQSQHAVTAHTPTEPEATQSAVAFKTSTMKLVEVKVNWFLPAFRAKGRLKGQCIMPFSRAMRSGCEGNSERALLPLRFILFMMNHHSFILASCGFNV